MPLTRQRGEGAMTALGEAVFTSGAFGGRPTPRLALRSSDRNNQDIRQPLLGGLEFVTVAVELQTRDPQPGNPMPLDGPLPGEQFLE